MQPFGDVHKNKNQASKTNTPTREQKSFYMVAPYAMWRRCWSNVILWYWGQLHTPGESQGTWHVGLWDGGSRKGLAFQHYRSLQKNREIFQVGTVIFKLFRSLILIFVFLLIHGEGRCEKVKG